VFTVLFCFRVVAQLIVANIETGILPAFERWHSGAMPYWMLFLVQVLILGLMVRTNRFYTTGKIIASPVLGRVLLIFGTIYLLGMVLRLGLGLTLFSDDRWFANHIPTFFHLVLASWVLVVGRVYMQ